MNRASSIGFAILCVAGFALGAASVALGAAASMLESLGAQAGEGGRALLLRVSAAALPSDRRDRYLEEWAAELGAMAARSRWERARFLASLLLVAVPRLAVSLRLPGIPWLE